MLCVFTFCLPSMQFSFWFMSIALIFQDSPNLNTECPKKGLPAFFKN